ncbi:ATP-binding protein [Cryobacterium roopkundense]|nr:ATP-binding protein [Cryobacterium roopkundense]
MFDEDRDDELPLSTLPGLTHYLKSDISAPKRLTIAQYEALDVGQRSQYNRGRLDHLAGNIIIVTPQVREAREAVGKFITDNRRLPHDKRPGLILTGDGTAGKTTTLQSTMLKVYAEHTKTFPQAAQRGRHPIAYIEVPYACTGKSLLEAFARFFGLTVAARDTQVTLMMRVCEAFRQAKTELIVIDELQNLSAGNRGSGESIQVLRQLHSEVLGIFILCGVNLRESQLFAGPTGRQLSGRFTFQDLQSFTLADTTAQIHWRGIIRGFEREMPLLAHTVDSLTKHSKALHCHTAGSISTLAKIFISSANTLIRADDPQAESITLELLLAQPRDKSAMEAGETHRPLKPASKKANPS